MSQHTRPAGPGRSARAVIRDGRQTRDAIEAVLAAPEEARQVARRAYEAVRAQLVRGELDKMPVDRLREITRGRVQLVPVKAAGLRTVGQVLAAGAAGLRQARGVEPKTAAQVLAAAKQMRATVEEQTRVRLDPDARTPEQTALLAALRRYERARSLPPGPSLEPFAAELGRYLGPAARGASRFRMLFTFSGSKKAEARAALERLATTLRSKEATAARKQLEKAAARAKRDKTPKATRRSENYLWKDYLTRPVAYNGLLIEVAELAPGQEASQGFLPADIAERVREFRLDESLLKTSLRGYQRFGAKFILVQERVILGDEMGLGKTMQSLAAMCHLAAHGATHFLVICPASVVVNWTREVERHTKLDVFRLHGPRREAAESAWTDKGGVGVTTFEALRAMSDVDVSLGLMVVDEAHYAKNPNALRTKAVSEWAGRSRRVLFLSGTPMENKVGEFRVLVGHLRPEVAQRVNIADGALSATLFRKAVAPVYLRRNQEDVLSELPPRLETEEWVPIEGAAARAYRKAVLAGNFMGMRRAAFDPGTTKGSAKLRRLVELVAESAGSGRKVVVFSYFRDVLATVTKTLGGKDGPGVLVIGPLTGDVPPDERQAMVDEFTRSARPAVLVCQVQAGGVGLNVQAASVVILAEPQLTPSIEEQAIARAHRMGQVRRVDVHRLLGEDSVDQRVLELLSVKREAFDEYARRSDMARATPDAVDTSEAALRRQIVETERRRLRAAG